MAYVGLGYDVGARCGHRRCWCCCRVWLLAIDKIKEVFAHLGLENVSQNVQINILFVVAVVSMNVITLRLHR